MRRVWSVRWRSLFLAGMLILSGNTAVMAKEDGNLYSPGTYVETVPGKVDDVTVEVTFSQDSIESIVVSDHNETEGIGTLAVEEIPAEIVEKQSLAIDGVTGATVTSDAIFAAVETAVLEAGGNLDKLLIKDEEEKERTSETLRADLVVAGGGGAGMTAAIRARQIGLDVILVEKMPFMGGAISVSGGNQVVMGSELQKEAGVLDDTVDSMIEDFMANGADLNVPELLTLYAENVGRTSDWLNAIGVTYDLEGGLHKLAEYSHDRELAYTGGGAGAGEALRRLVDESGAKVLLDTRVMEITVDEGGIVTGVKASGKDTDYTIEANAVLLSTGGYGNNKDLLSEEMKEALYYGPVSSTGDGLLMATSPGIDAAVRLMEYGKRYPNGIEVEKGIAKSTIAGNLSAWTMAAVLVDADGQRLVNEKASNRTILEAELMEPDQTIYLVMDSETFNVWRTKLGAAGISESDIDRYLAANGSEVPIFAHGGTLEEAAENAGISPEGLASTVERYNKYAESGVDEEFGRAPEYMTMPFGAGPYYIVEQKPRFATTMGGLVVNPRLQVMNTSGQVIDGLYAAGEVVGGVMGDDSPSGANNGWAVTSGKIAAENIAIELGFSIPGDLPAAMSMNTEISEKDIQVNPEETPVKLYTPGVYTASSAGLNSDIMLTVEFSDSTILSIDFQSEETPEIGGAALASLTDEVLASQGVDFDAVDGATVSSEAFRSALMDCIRQASAV